MFWFHSSQSSLLSTCTALFDGDKDALKSFQSKLKGEQTREKGNMEGGEREEGRKGSGGETGMFVGKTYSDD